MDSDLTNIFLWMTVSVASGAFFPIDTLKCLYLGGRTVRCSYDDEKNGQDKYSCRMTPIPGNMECENVSHSYWVNSTRGTGGVCEYECNPCTCTAYMANCSQCGMCRTRVAVAISTSDNRSCKVLHLPDIYKPGPVEKLQHSINRHWLMLNWSRPHDYHSSVKYIYSIIVETEHEQRNYTKRSRAVRVKRRIKMSHYKPWMYYNITMTAASKYGFPSDPVYIREWNDTITEVIIERISVQETSLSIWIPIVVICLIITAAAATSVIIKYYKYKCCNKITIILPKLAESDDSLHDVSTALVHDTKPQIEPDSGRGSLESNNTHLNTALCVSDSSKHQDLSGVQDPGFLEAGDQDPKDVDEGTGELFVNPGKGGTDLECVNPSDNDDKSQEDPFDVDDSAASGLSIYRMNVNCLSIASDSAETVSDIKSDNSNHSDRASAESYSIIVEKSKPHSEDHEDRVCSVKDEISQRIVNFSKKSQLAKCKLSQTIDSENIENLKT